MFFEFEWRRLQSRDHVWIWSILWNKLTHKSSTMSALCLFYPAEIRWCRDSYGISGRGTYILSTFYLIFVDMSEYEEIQGESLAVAASSSNPRDIQLVVHLFSSQHTGSFTAQHYLKCQSMSPDWWQSVTCLWNIEISGISMDILDIP